MRQSIQRAVIGSLYAYNYNQLAKAKPVGIDQHGRQKRNLANNRLLLQEAYAQNDGFNPG